MQDPNIALVRSLHDMWNTGDVSRVDDIYAEDFLGHWPAGSPIPLRKGRDGVAFGIQRIRAAFPDWMESIDDIFGSGDRVAVRYTSRGTHAGLFEGVEPTGRRIELQEMSIYRIASGRVAEQWCMFDGSERLRQLTA